MTITGTIPSAIAAFLNTENKSLDGLEIKANDVDVIFTEHGDFTELYAIGTGNGSYEIVEIEDNLNLLPEYEVGDIISNDVLKKLFSTVINSSLILSWNPLGKIKYGISDKAKNAAKGVKKGFNKIKEAGKFVADIVTIEDAQNWIRKQKGFEKAKVGKVQRLPGITGGYYAVLAGNPADKKYSVWKIYRNGNEYRTLARDFYEDPAEALTAYNTLARIKENEEPVENEEIHQEEEPEESNVYEQDDNGEWQYTDDGVAYKISSSAVEDDKTSTKKKKKSKYNGLNVTGCVESDGNVALA